MTINDNLALLKKSYCSICRRWFLNTAHGIFITASVFVREAYMPVLLFFLFLATEDIGGWSFYEMLLFQSLVSISYAFLVLFFTGLRDLTTERKGGVLSWAMLRPCGVLTQVLLSDIDWFAVVGHGLLGIILFVIGIVGSGTTLSLAKFVVLLINIAGAILIQAAIWLFLAALKLFDKTTGTLKNLLFYIPRMFAYLPITILPQILANVFVYVIPYAFISYFPILGFLGMADVNYPSCFVYISLPIGVVLYLGAYLLWRLGLKHWLKVV